MNGLAIKLEKWGFKTPEQIMEEHINHISKANAVYFSTDLAIDQKLCKQIDVALFYNVKSDIYYLCDVARIEKRKVKGNRSTMDNVFIPEDANVLSVPAYAEEPRKTWILLTRIERIDKSKLIDWNTLTESVSVAEKVNSTGRFNRFYFYG